MKTHKSHFSNEHGAAAFYAIAGLGSMLFLLHKGQTVFGSNVSPAIYWTSVTLAGIIALCSMGCSLHLRRIGLPSHRELREELQSKSEELDELLNSSASRLQAVEVTVSSNFSSMSRDGIDSLSLIKKITRALDRRNKRIQKLLASRDEIDLIEAHNTIAEDLDIIESAMDGLIDRDPIPAIQSSELGLTLEKLFSDVDGEIQKVA